MGGGFNIDLHTSPGGRRRPTQSRPRRLPSDTGGDTMETEAAAFKKATGMDLHPRQDQPMEVDAIASAVAAKLQPTSPQPPIDAQRQATEIAKLKAQVADLKKAATRPPKSPPQLYRGQSWSHAPAPGMNQRLLPNQEHLPGAPGKPRSGLLCFTCGRPGHLARACQTKN